MYFFIFLLFYLLFFEKRFKLINTEIFPTYWLYGDSATFYNFLPNIQKQRRESVPKPIWLTLFVLPVEMAIRLFYSGLYALHKLEIRHLWYPSKGEKISIRQVRKIRSIYRDKWTQICDLIWSFFRSVFSCVQSEYSKIRTRKNSVFGHFSRSDLPDLCHNPEKTAIMKNFRYNLYFNWKVPTNIDRLNIGV